jgi:hypothetical protein
LNRRVLMSTRILVLAIVLGGFSCDTTEPPPPPPPPPPEPVPTITLSVVDSGLTEVWLRVAIPDTIPDRDFLLMRNGETADASSLSGPDTVLLDDGLVPNTGYAYRACRFVDTVRVDSTDLVQVVTLDTTSHTFTWEMFEWGDHSSSMLLDVVIINENDIWAAGEIFQKDSIIGYNALHWDGTQWNLLRIQFPAFCGQPGTAPFRTYSSHHFASGVTWIASAGQIAEWNGTPFTISCIPLELINGSIREISGASRNSAYLVGDRGTIVYFNGVGWTRIESGTDVDINDVWGARDLVTGETVIYAVATNGDGFGERIMLQIHPDGSVSQASYTPQRFLQTVWFSSPEKIFLGGGTVFVGQPGDWTEIPEASTHFSYEIRGSARNNIFVVGDFGHVAHYNGSTWKTYPELFLGNGSYFSVAAKDDLVVAVGQHEGRAVVLRGYRK